MRIKLEHFPVLSPVQTDATTPNIVRTCSVLWEGYVYGYLHGDHM